VKPEEIVLQALQRLQDKLGVIQIALADDATQQIQQQEQQMAY